MPTNPIDKELCEQAVSLVNEALRAGYHFGRTPSATVEVGRRLGVPSTAIQHRLRVAKERYGLEIDLSLDAHRQKPSESDIRPPPERPTETDQLAETNRRLKAELAAIKREELTREAVRTHILALRDSVPTPPRWLEKPRKARKGALGVPTLFCSDWHWSEVVKPTEVSGFNEFNLEIAHQRVKRLTETTLSLLFDHIANPQYDGLVLVLGGDLVSGDIHEELTATNSLPIMPTVVDLYGCLIGMINTLADRFGNVFIPCVTGNHGRNTRKIQAKERWATSFDWLVYCLLAKHYERDKRITFSIPDGPDCEYRVYGHRYKLTHGDQFRGGDGLIGPLGPVTRGRHKKASRDAGMGTHWDTMLVGHFHSLMQLPHLIMNGSLKGYDEYAFAGNFSPEAPAQACWITHPDRGITFQMPVYLDDPEENESSPWVSVPRAA